MKNDNQNEFRITREMYDDGPNDEPSGYLKKVLETSEQIRKIMSKEIKFSKPILRQAENAVIFPNTINVIQGQNGVHKSRLAETICAAFLKLTDNQRQLLNFNRLSDNYSVVYVDTERNLKEQFPFALQSIQTLAGFQISERPKNFEFISLLQIPRKERFEVLTKYISRLKKTINNPMLIVLDVSTDCLEDFNKVEKSMELIDLMNMVINEEDVVFLCIIHENPGSEKARGHFGTELMNKATTVIQVGFVKDGNIDDTEIIKLKYKKCRNTAKNAAFHYKYSLEKNELITVDENEVLEIISSRKKKANYEDIIDSIEILFIGKNEIARSDFIPKLCDELSASERTIETRLKEIIEAKKDIINSGGDNCFLTKETIGKNVLYQLIKK